MRASSLSNARVIDLLNAYFVAVNVRNRDFGEGGAAPPQERTEKDRIYRDSLSAGLSAGSVCAYILTPDGRPIATAPLNQKLATDPEKFAELLERLAGEQKIAKARPVVEPAAQSHAPERRTDSLALHIVARYLERRGEELVPVDVQSILGSRKGGNWGDLPSEDWVVLRQSEWTKLLPQGEVRAGDSWELDRTVAASILRNFFPPTENTDVRKNRIDALSLTGTVASVDNGVARARLGGRLKMKHPFYHQDDDNFVETVLAGYVEFEPGQLRIRTLRLVTDGATYGVATDRTQFFGAAARSVP